MNKKLWIEKDNLEQNNKNKSAKSLTILTINLLLKKF